MTRRGIVVVHDGFALMGGAERVAVRLAARARRLGPVDLAALFTGGAPHGTERDLFDEVVVLDAPRRLSARTSVGVVRAHRRLAKLVERRRPVACVAFSYPAVVRLALVLRGSSVPLVWVLQEDLEHLGFRRRGWRRRLALALLARCVTRVVHLSAESRSKLVELGFAAEALRHVELGVEPPAALAREPCEPRASRDDGADLVAVCVAHLNPAKRHDVLLEAVRVARAGGVRVRLVCVGGAFPGYEDHARWLASETERLGVADLVTWVGLRKDVGLWLARADVAVLASDHEVAPLALMEAAAHGLPLVGTDAPGVREVVRHGDTGLTFPIGDAPACAAVFSTLARDPALRARLAAAARARVESSQARMERAWDAVLDELVGGR